MFPVGHVCSAAGSLESELGLVVICDGTHMPASSTDRAAHKGTRRMTLSAMSAALAFMVVALLAGGAYGQTPGASLMPADGGASALKHFDPKGQPPSKFTIELRNGQRAALPLDD